MHIYQPTVCGSKMQSRLTSSLPHSKFLLRASRVGDRMIQGKPQETNSEHETSLIIQ